MTKRLLRSLVVAAIFTALWVAPSHAGSMLQKQMDFLGNVSGGSFMYTPGPLGNLMVTNANIGSITAFPSFDTLKITDGFLNFATGTCKAGCVTHTNKGISTANPSFNWGGYLKITGELPGMSSPVTLLYGMFSPTGLTSGDKNGLSVPNASLTTKGHKGGFNGSLQITEINPLIYSEFLPYIFNVPSGNGRSYMSEMMVDVNFATTGPLPHIWTGVVSSTDIIVKPTPEPSGLFLLASVLLVGAGLLRRRANFVA